MTTTANKPAASRAARTTSTTRSTAAKPAASKATAAKPATSKPAAAKKAAPAKKEAPKAYKILTGIDDSTFCERVSAALDEGYELYGSPAITFNGKNNIVAQALTYKKKPKGKKKK